ncbi:Uncharacterized protein BP5553_02855 [Venustampulla echinocandica]|uniref:Uncharacterized protein n=1 Tax=Venustampulla echinocandica TaxID=2656787 RepID=A0A370TSK2_9HELO|nr:Uncharacterized protein BP5553_02855 [Venustampulla echinocandica]RDL38515.1 Uncharacterized protein BP5553_02855 [Venustampulla echinocandica]
MTNKHSYTVLDPPDLSQILNGDDQLEPNPQELETAIEKCREYWYHLTAMAMSQRHNGILPEYVNPRNMLGRVPAICKGLRGTYSGHFGSSPSKALCVQAFSTWRVTDNTSCVVVKEEKKIPGLLQIGTRVPIPCKFGGDTFSRWVGTTCEERDMPSYLGILALGWCYILSARLVEGQGEDAKMIYTGSTATRYHQESEPAPALTTTVNIGEVGEDVARWWAAILAPGEGWKAIVSQRDDGEYLAPWSVSREDTHCVGIKWRRNLSVPEDFTGSTPPSSSKAFELLAQFSLLHNLGSQFLVALAMAITFPTHNYHATAVHLPLPTGIRDEEENAFPRSIIPEWITVNEELPFYMSLSCSPEVVMSSLCGMFWEADVTCNLVSPWLHPILNEVPEGKGITETPGRYYEIIAIICGLRRPRISALFLGAAASGLMPTILRSIRGGRPPLDVNAFPWTGCPQSFMDIPGSGPYICEGTGNKVRRADVWRLLYLPPVVEDDLYYNNPPFTPWAPFGNSSVQNCVFRVASHLHCTRHYLEYQHWNWELVDGSIAEDQGFDKGAVQYFLEAGSSKIELITTTEFPKIQLNQEASEEASLDVFRWVMVNGEGVPPEEVYKDKWVQFDDDSDEELDSVIDDNSVVADKQQNGLEEWLGGTIEAIPDEFV